MKKSHPLLLILAAVLLGSASTAGTYYILQRDIDNQNSQPSPVISQQINDDGSILNIPSRKNTNTVAYVPPVNNPVNNTVEIVEPIEPPAVETWQRYANSTYGFSLDYPPDWQLTFEETDTKLHYFLLSIQPPNTEDLFLFGRQAMGFEDTETLEEVDTTIGGMSARNISLQDPSSNKTFALLLMAKKVPKKYQQYFGSYALGTPELIPEYEKIVESITFSE